MIDEKLAGSPPVLFAACDEQYFRTHAKGFCASGLAAGHRVHIMISPEPGHDLPSRAKSLADSLVPRFRYSFGADEQARLVIEVVEEKRATVPMDGTDRVVFFQCLRYFQLPGLLRRYKCPVVVLDIDSLIRAPIPASSDGDVGLFLRPNKKNWKSEEQRLGWQVLGAMVYASATAVDFFDAVLDYIDSNERRPYIDQRALYEVYKKNTARVFDLSKTHWLDWNFGSKSLVWTAKGRQRRRSLVYLRERMKFERRGWIVSAFLIAGYKLRVLQA